MRRCRPAIEQPRCGEHEDTRADRHEPGAARVRTPQRADERRRRHVVDAPPGNDDRAGLRELRESASRLDEQAARRAERTAFERTDTEPIPVRSHLGPPQAKHFYDNAELERAETVVGERRDATMV